MHRALFMLFAATVWRWRWPVVVLYIVTVGVLEVLLLAAILPSVRT